ncbi:MAG: PIN domain-containing protein, partial [Gammaproteobacteria bacterium]
MIVVDASVWIDYFNGSRTPETDTLDTLLGREIIVVGDITLTEVLQGFSREGDFNRALGLLQALE